MSDSPIADATTSLGERMRAVRDAVLAEKDDADVLLLTDAVIETEADPVPTEPQVQAPAVVAPVSAVAEVLVGSDQRVESSRAEVVRGEVRAWLDQHGARLVQQYVAEQLANRPVASTDNQHHLQ